MSLGPRDRQVRGGLPGVVVEFEGRVDRPSLVLGRLGADRVERVDVLGREAVDIRAIAVWAADDVGRADLGDVGDRRSRTQAAGRAVTRTRVDIEDVVGGVLEVALGDEAVRTDLPRVADPPFEAGRRRQGGAAVVLHQLTRLAGIVDAARIGRDQRVVDWVGAGGGLVADLDRAQAVVPRVHGDRIAAELLVLPGHHAEHGEVVRQVLVIAQRGERAAEVAQVIVLVRDLGEAAVLAAQGRIDAQVDIARQAAGQIGRRRRLDDVDGGEDVRVEGAQRGRAIQDRIGERAAVQGGAGEGAGDAHD